MIKEENRKVKKRIKGLKLQAQLSRTGMNDSFLSAPCRSFCPLHSTFAEFAAACTTLYEKLCQVVSFSKNFSFSCPPKN